MKREKHVARYAEYRNKQDEKISDLKKRVYDLERMLDFLVGELMERLS